MNPLLWPITGPPALSGPRHGICRACLSAALLLTLLSPEGVQAQPVPPVSLETLVFLSNDSLESIRANYTSRLASKLSAIDRTCQLTADQRRALELAGKGDIKRFFDQFFALKKEVLDRGLLPEAPQFAVEVERLRIKASSGLFHEQSLMGKSVRSTLTPEQLLRYDEMSVKEHQLLTQAAIDRLDQLLMHVGAWPNRQRVQFLSLLRNKLEPVRNSGPYDFCCLVLQLGKKGRDEYENLLPANQRTALAQYIEFARRHEVSLHQAGYFAADDNEDGRPAKPPADSTKK
jgi:hypothetical protein